MRDRLITVGSLWFAGGPRTDLMRGGCQCGVGVVWLDSITRRPHTWSGVLEKGYVIRLPTCRELLI